MKASRSLLLSCFLVIAVGQSVAASNLKRQAVPPGGVAVPTVSPTPTSASSSSSSSSSSTSEESKSSSSSSTTSSSSSSTSESSSSSSESSSSSSSSSSPTAPTAAPTAPPSPSPSLEPVRTSESTDASGVVVVVTVFNTSSPSSSPTSAPTKGSSNDDDNSSPAIGTGSIVGIAVAGGIAVIGIIAFLVWKFTRKRFSDFDDNEAIKWPELNAHGGNVDSHPLPVNNTGRAGFDTASDLSRVPSSSYSTPDLGGAGPDPYAVPPLPHMNPNQPYRDDPTAASGYYDPYRGPIPGTLEHGTAGDDWTGEAIPMTQMAGPHAAYATSEYDLGRRSPGPQAGGYGGRSSPGPQVAYGGRASPAPQSVYAAGRMSPAPQAAYEHYGVPR